MVKFEDPISVEDISDCIFYHKMDLPGIGTVGGSWDLRGRFDQYVDNAKLEGKSVLDIGAAGGFLSFEAEKRGAEVVSFDMDDKRRQHFLPYQGHPCYDDKDAYYAQLNAGYQQWKNGYWLAHRAMGSKARVFHGDIYDLPTDLGRFDVVMVGCVMMHLANPILALESISRVSSDKIIIIDTVHPDTQEKVAYMQSRADDPGGHFIWFVYSVALYREVFAMMGYDLVGNSQAAYPCCAYTDADGNPETRDVLLTTLTAQRRR